MKHPVFPALVLISISFSFPFATTPGRCQEAVAPSPASNNTSLPNAPSTTQETTCTERNGKPGSEWLHKLIGQHPPPLPPSEPLLGRDPSTVHLWTYRGWNEPPLRTNKEVFRSKAFIGAHVGGAIAMVVACRNKNSGKNWGSEVPIVAGLFGMDYLQFRFVGGPNAVGPAVYEMVQYGQASTK